jgi:TPP-dependent pyruvate/acetoin dehydrogenase alpha subunit
MRDPIARLESTLRDRGLGDECAAIRLSLAAEIQAALAFARASDYPPADDLLGTVYANGETV